LSSRDKFPEFLSKSSGPDYLCRSRRKTVVVVVVVVTWEKIGLSQSSVKQAAAKFAQKAWEVLRNDFQ
jgi:hypothetical protein